MLFADFGHAQHRRRWFLIATRDARVNLTPPEPTFVPATDVLEEHLGKRVTRRLYVADQIEAITDPDVPHLVTYRRHARPRRADQHRLATITAGGNHHAVATVIAGGTAWHRMLTNRECARAQGFADEHEFVGNTAEVKRQIGNAVPVGIASWLGTRAANALTTTHLAA
ncbi:DNA cytosine methyltransferase [Prauserella isguenensis]|uniref:DNA cytosine methyltransferase n=1 Tax=Prauserella isguenensis TaxID=1470180 RepID=UPI001617CA93